MKIPVNLNGQKIVLDSSPDDTLTKVLHENGCISVKSGCTRGFCGACTVLVEDRPVASCKIPVGFVKDKKIVTLESFSKTDYYQTIIEGFNKAGIKLCGYCNSGKIFSAYQILKLNKIPSRQEITDTLKSLSPCCTDLETLVNGVIYALQAQNKKIKRITKES